MRFITETPQRYINRAFIYARKTDSTVVETFLNSFQRFYKQAAIINPQVWRYDIEAPSDIYNQMAVVISSQSIPCIITRELIDNEINITGGSSYTQLLASLVYYWKYDVNYTDSVASATMVASGTAALVPGFIGNGVSLANSTNDKVLIANVMPTAFTINYWIFRTGTTNLNSCFGWGTGAMFLLMRLINASVDFSATLYNGSTSVEVSTPATNVPINTYNMVTLTKSGDTFTLFVNGLQLATNTQTGMTPVANFGLGRTIDAGAQTLGCVMDELGYWNRVLTQAEITILYNGGSGLTYPFVSTV